MTFREQLQQDRPEKVDPAYFGGCIGCPLNYDYESVKEYEDNCDFPNCTACWNREIPEKKNR